MSKAKKILISAFLFFCGLVMLRASMPLQNPVVGSLYRPVDSYLSFFSLYQSWRMFAPEPPKENAYISAEVEFDDGTKDTFTFTNGSGLSLWDKYAYGERMRVLGESLRNDNNSFLWDDAAKFALRKLKSSNYRKIPLKVELFRHWSPIPDMKNTIRPHLSNSTNFKNYNFYTYEVL